MSNRRLSPLNLQIIQALHGKSTRELLITLESELDRERRFSIRQIIEWREAGNPLGYAQPKKKATLGFRGFLLSLFDKLISLFARARIALTPPD